MTRRTRRNATRRPDDGVSVSPTEYWRRVTDPTARAPDVELHGIYDSHMSQQHTTPPTTDADREQTAAALQDVIDATESVNWRDVPEVDTADVSKWCQKLQYAHRVAARDLEE